MRLREVVTLPVLGRDPVPPQVLARARVRWFQVMSSQVPAGQGESAWVQLPSHSRKGRCFLEGQPGSNGHRPAHGHTSRGACPARGCRCAYVPCPQPPRTWKTHSHSHGAGSWAGARERQDMASREQSRRWPAAPAARTCGQDTGKYLWARPGATCPLTIPRRDPQPPPRAQAAARTGPPLHGLLDLPPDPGRRRGPSAGDEEEGL